MVSSGRDAWIKGRDASCPIRPAPPARPWRLVLLGAPGVGKGMQAELIAARLGPCRLSTGEVFRSASQLEPCDRTPALEAALESMRRGELVRDATVLALLRERVACLRCHGGFVLDGFPRTVGQAEALDEILRFERIRLDGVLSYEMPIAAVVQRLAGRRVCASCQAVFHVEAAPARTEGRCDRCGGELGLREDDLPAALRVRLLTYERTVAPLTRHYAGRGLLRPVSAVGSPEEVYGRTLTALGLAG